MQYGMKKNPYSKINKATQEHNTAKNILNREFSWITPLKKLWTDISYLYYNWNKAYISILKDEWLNQIKLVSLEQAIKELKRIITIYNCHRPHLSLGMKTPEYAHNQMGKLKKYWKTYNEIPNKKVF